MFAFTKQEQKFLFLIIAAFFIGLTIKYYRQSAAERHEERSWEVEHDHIYKDFRDAAQKETYENDSKKERAKEVSKQAITGNININSATFDELQILPRIGPATAKKIIDYRNEKGPFEKKSDIQNVKSIGPKTFEKIERYITVDQ